MRLDLLIDRELFAEIFSKTLSSYLANKFNWSGEVCYGKSKPRIKKYFLVNTKLNLIYHRKQNTNILRQLASEYAYHPNLIRKLAQHLYVRYAVSMPLRRFLSSYYVSMNPFPKQCTNWCILPGNNSIRIVDIENNECIVLRKDGFNKNYMRNLIRLRNRYPELPGPQILHFDLGAGWYVEERIKGLPLNRLNNDLRMTRVTNSARLSMLHLYDQTSSKVECSVWRRSIAQEIYSAIHSLPEVYSLVLRQQVESFVKRLILHLAEFYPEKKFVDIVQSHGDFQPANILMPTVSDQRLVYLIDWEYTGKRCRWYDAMVFELHSRSPKGLASRITRWLSDEKIAHHSIEWCRLDRKDTAAGYVAATFLLEDLLLRLVDTTIPGLRQPDKGFLCFVDELLSVNPNTF
jgi:hypothetical protein